MTEPWGIAAWGWASMPAGGAAGVSQGTAAWTSARRQHPCAWQLLWRGAGPSAAEAALVHVGCAALSCSLDQLARIQACPSAVLEWAALAYSQAWTGAVLKRAL